MLSNVVRRLLAGDISRNEVHSWQEAVFAEYGWDIPISVREGFWYFFSLMRVLSRDEAGEYLIRDSDLAEFLADMKGHVPVAAHPSIVPLRSHQIDPEELRWPLTILNAEDTGVLDEIPVPVVRGSFEHRLDLVEHRHLSHEGVNYLLVRHLDELGHELMVLGSSREPEKLQSLISALVRS